MRWTADRKVRRTTDQVSSGVRCNQSDYAQMIGAFRALADGSPFAAGDPPGEFVRRQWLRDPVALCQIATEVAHNSEALRGFDPFGDDRQAQAVAQFDGRAHDGGVLCLFRCMRYEGAIDLEFVALQALNVGERGIARAVIVDGQPQSLFLQRPDRFLRAMGILHQRTLGYL